MRSLRRKGQDVLFKEYARQVESFAQKYSLKKFTLIPFLNETRRTTEQDILRAIPNYRILGLHRRVKGSNLDIFTNLVLMKVAKVRFRMM
jgi:hypothetical protein